MVPSLSEFGTAKCVRIIIDGNQLKPCDCNTNCMVVAFDCNKKLMSIFCENKPQPNEVALIIMWISLKQVVIAHDDFKVFIDVDETCDFKKCEILVDKDELDNLEVALSAICARYLLKKYGDAGRDHISAICTVEDTGFGMDEDAASLNSVEIIPSSCVTVDSPQAILACDSDEPLTNLDQTQYIVEETPPNENIILGTQPATPEPVKYPQKYEDTASQPKFFNNDQFTENDEMEICVTSTYDSDNDSRLSRSSMSDIIVPDTDFEKCPSDYSETELKNVFEQTLTHMETEENKNPPERETNVISAHMDNILRRNIKRDGKTTILMFRPDESKSCDEETNCTRNPESGTTSVVFNNFSDLVQKVVSSEYATEELKKSLSLSGSSSSVSSEVSPEENEVIRRILTDNEAFEVTVIENGDTQKRGSQSSLKEKSLSGSGRLKVMEPAEINKLFVASAIEGSQQTKTPSQKKEEVNVVQPQKNSDLNLKEKMELLIKQKVQEKNVEVNNNEEIPVKKRRASLQKQQQQQPVITKQQIENNTPIVSDHEIESPISSDDEGIRKPTTPTKQPVFATPKQIRKRCVDSDSDEWTPHGIIKYKKPRKSKRHTNEEPLNNSFFSEYSRETKMIQTRTRVVTRNSRLIDEVQSEVETRQRKLQTRQRAYATDNEVTEKKTRRCNKLPAKQNSIDQAKESTGRQTRSNIELNRISSDLPPVKHIKTNLPLNQNSANLLDTDYSSKTGKLPGVQKGRASCPNTPVRHMKSNLPLSQNSPKNPDKDSLNKAKESSEVQKGRQIRANTPARQMKSNLPLSQNSEKPLEKEAKEPAAVQKGRGSRANTPLRRLSTNRRLSQSSINTLDTDSDQEKESSAAKKGRQRRANTPLRRLSTNRRLSQSSINTLDTDSDQEKESSAAKKGRQKRANTPLRRLSTNRRLSQCSTNTLDTDSDQEKESSAVKKGRQRRANTPLRRLSTNPNQNSAKIVDTDSDQVKKTPGVQKGRPKRSNIPLSTNLPLNRYSVETDSDQAKKSAGVQNGRQSRPSTPFNMKSKLPLRQNEVKSTDTDSDQSGVQKGRQSRPSTPFNMKSKLPLRQNEAKSTDTDSDQPDVQKGRQSRPNTPFNVRSKLPLRQNEAKNTDTDSDQPDVQKGRQGRLNTSLPPNKNLSKIIDSEETKVVKNKRGRPPRSTNIPSKLRELLLKQKSPLKCKTTPVAIQNLSSSQESNYLGRPKTSVIIRNHSQSSCSTPRRRLSCSQKSVLEEMPEEPKISLKFKLVKNDKEFDKIFMDHLSQDSIGFNDHRSEDEHQNDKENVQSSQSSKDAVANDPPKKTFQIFTSGSSNYNHSSPELVKNKAPAKSSTKKVQSKSSASILKPVDNKLPPVVLPDPVSPNPFSISDELVDELHVQPYLFQKIEPKSKKNPVDSTKTQNKVKKLLTTLKKSNGKRMSQNECLYLGIEVFRMCLLCQNNLLNEKRALLYHFNHIYCNILKLAVPVLDL